MAAALGLSDEDIKKVRLAALLHDVGHCAFSHVVESIIKQNPGYQPILEGKRFLRHEMFTRYMITNSFNKNETISRLIGEQHDSFLKK